MPRSLPASNDWAILAGSSARRLWLAISTRSGRLLAKRKSRVLCQLWDRHRSDVCQYVPQSSGPFESSMGRSTSRIIGFWVGLGGRLLTMRRMLGAMGSWASVSLLARRRVHCKAYGWSGRPRYTRAAGRAYGPTPHVAAGPPSIRVYGIRWSIPDHVLGARGKRTLPSYVQTSDVAGYSTIAL